jgi:hypothetical protein
VSKLRQRAVFGVSVLVLGAVLFILASAFVIDRHYSPILAAIVGGLAFPVAPALWHLLGERGRTRKLADVKPVKGAPAPKPSTLTGFDRYWMRFVGVAIVVLAPMFIIARTGVFRAAIHHGLWFIPTPPPDLRGIGSDTPRDFKDHDLLLKHLPPETEVAVAFHDPNEGGNLVAGWAAGHSALVSVGRILLPGGASLEDAVRSRSWYSNDTFSTVSTLDGTDAFASDAWRNKIQLPGDGPSTALRRELARAPQAAPFVVAWVPRSPKEAKAIHGAAAWLVMTEDTVVIEGRLETGDIITAFETYARINNQLVGDHDAERPSKCRHLLSDLADRVTVVQNGTVITARLTATRSEMADLVVCGMPSS